MIKNFLWNIISAAIPVVVLQLIIYPILAQKIDSNAYGLMTTMYSCLMLVPYVLGNVLNNVRLLYHKKYVESHIEGDFNIWQILFLIISLSFICICSLYYYEEVDVIGVLLIVLAAPIVCICAYIEVGLLINLDYKRVLVSNIIMAIGYILGLFFAIISQKWEGIFLLGQLLKGVYLYKNTSLLREKIQKTLLFKTISKDTMLLLSAVFLSNIMNYADKMILFPILGGTLVSIYYTATILGKIVGMVVTPISSVILSYISKRDNLERKKFNRVLLVGICVCTIGYCICMLISKFILGILFPQWVDQVMEYIPITTIALSLNALCSIIHPFVLKFCDMKWQIVINGVSSMTYLACSLIFLQISGLTGFCIGTVIGYLSKVILLIFIYYKFSTNKKLKVNV